MGLFPLLASLPLGFPGGPFFIGPREGFDLIHRRQRGSDLLWGEGAVFIGRTRERNQQLRSIGEVNRLLGLEPAIAHNCFDDGHGSSRSRRTSISHLTSLSSSRSF